MARHSAISFGSGGGERQFPTLRIIRVGANLVFEALSEECLRFGIALLVTLALGLRRPVLQEPRGFAMEPIGGPIRCHVGAMSPNASQLLTANRLPDVLAIFDVLAD